MDAVTRQIVTAIAQTATAQAETARIQKSSLATEQSGAGTQNTATSLTRFSNSVVSQKQYPATILIIDDEVAFALTLALTLQAEGYNTHYADTAATAFQFIATTPPDLILLDLFLSQDSGFDICSHLKADPFTQNIPILFLSSSPSTDHIVEAFQRGAADYIKKPFNTAELLARTTTHLKLRQQASQIQQNQDKLDSILTYIQDGIIAIAANGHVQFANPAAKTMLGWGQTHAPPPPVLSLSQFENNTELEILRLNGQQGIAQTSVSHLEWDGMQISIICLRDISDHKQAEADLQTALQEQRQLSTELDQLARTDDLTQCCNRRHIIEQLQQEFNRSRRYHDSLAVLIVDIDRFKRVNDTYGHAVGDQVLQVIAAQLRQICRQVDSVGRFGGEEFLLVLPATPETEAVVFAQRLCDHIRQLQIPYEGGSLTVTISIGVAQYDPKDNDVTALIKRADIALYHAKEEGRDRIACALDL